MYNYFKLILIYFIIIFIRHQYVLCNEQIPNQFNRQMSIIEDLNWNLKNQTNSIYKQIPGVAYNNSKLSIFHRSFVQWDEFSFDRYNVYRHQDQVITDDPILNFNLSGNLIGSWGKNYFFMPHGISFDSDGNAWLTDVALHQVFKFNKNNLEVPEIILGERFVPGTDEKHFCKPTDVQVSSKFVYISDGYCNSRVMAFTKNGKFIKEFGSETNMVVVHSLSLINELDLICSADRENARILCFDAGIKNDNNLGKLRKILHPNDFPGQLFAIQNIGTYLFSVYVVNYQNSNYVKGIIFDLNKDSDQPIWKKNISSLVLPHDITVDDNNYLYISEIGSKAEKLLRKFKINLNEDKLVQRQVQIVNEKPKSKRIDTKEKEEEDLKNLASGSITTTTETNSITTESAASSSDSSPIKPKKSSLLLLLFFISSLLLISIVLFFLKKRIGIENYFRSLGIPSKVTFSKDLYINDPERSGFNLLREEEELFDFEMDNNSSESEVEEFNFKSVRKV